MTPAASTRVNVVASAMGVVASVLLIVAWLAREIQTIPGTLARYVISFALLESAVMVVMVVGVVVAKSVRTRAERVAGQRRKLIEELLIWCPDSNTLDRVANEWPRELFEVADEVLGFLLGPVRKRILKLIEASSCRGILLRALESNNPREATQAVRILSECEGQACRSAVSGAIYHPLIQVRAAVVKALLRNGDDELKLGILATLPRIPLWERVVMFHSLNFDTEVVRLFTERAFSGEDDQLKIAALELVHAGRRHVPTLLPPALAVSGNVELRIKFFKALPYCHIPDDLLPLLGSGLEDPDWRVRAMAAKACAQLRPAPLARNLLAMCRAATHQAEIRHAALALAAIGGEAQFQLERLAAAGLGMAGQIAAEVLEERIITLMGARK